MKCVRCGAIFATDTIGGKYYCSKCFDEIAITLMRVEKDDRH
jgi:DNA-directed RNA polymerase subunit RPC12/RpoP